MGDNRKNTGVTLWWSDQTFEHRCPVYGRRRDIQCHTDGKHEYAHCSVCLQDFVCIDPLELPRKWTMISPPQ